MNSKRYHIKKEFVALALTLGLAIIFILPTLQDFKDNDKDKEPNYLMRIIKWLIILGVVVSYPVLLDLSKDDFHFELTPEKHCEGGPYMWTSDPEKQKFCSKFTKADMARYECGVGFHGAPIWRGGAGNQPPESNSNWKNERCSDVNSDNGPQVL
jgi:hypothetical protein